MVEIQKREQQTFRTEAQSHVIESWITMCYGLLKGKETLPPGFPSSALTGTEHPPKPTLYHLCRQDSNQKWQRMKSGKFIKYEQTNLFLILKLALLGLDFSPVRALKAVSFTEVSGSCVTCRAALQVPHNIVTFDSWGQSRSINCRRIKLTTTWPHGVAPDLLGYINREQIHWSAVLAIQKARILFFWCNKQDGNSPMHLLSHTSHLKSSLMKTLH